MLSILPYAERASAATASSNQSNPHHHHHRSSHIPAERPFKSYPRSTLPSAPPTAHNTPPSAYLSPFGHHNIIGSLHPLHHHTGSYQHQGHPSKQDAPMDLRPQASMYDGRDSYEHHAAAPYMDLSAQFANRIPNIKTEEQGLVNALYSQVNNNPAHSNGGYPSMAPNMPPSMRDMSPPTQASLPTLSNNGSAAVVSSAAATTSPDMRAMDRVGSGNRSIFSDALDHTPNHSSSSSHAAAAAASGSAPPNNNNTTPPPLVVSPHSNAASSSSSNADNSNPDDPRAGDKRPINTVPEEMKDTAYWEKRKKNNDSAKRSREARRIKEEQIAMRVVYLEQDNLQLRTEVSLLKSEIEKLRCMLYNS